MRKNRFWLSLSFAFVLLLTLVGTGFGLFYVGDTDPVSVDNIGTRVDDIEENYILEDAGVNQDNYYDVYFFCTPYAAQVDPSRLIELAPGRGGNGYDSAVRFYWWDGGTAAQESQPSQSNYGQNGWRKIRVYRSISAEQFNNIGTPVAGKGNKEVENTDDPASNYWDCDIQDGVTKYWPLDFSGWTANRQAASNTINFNSGAYNQGNFDYVDAFSPLSQIDSGTEDGSQKDDNKIYLYPIFTTGKNYNRTQDVSNESSFSQQPAIRLSFSNPNGYKGAGHYFFAQEKEDNEAIYTYKNLTIEEESDLSKYNLEVTPMKWASTYHFRGNQETIGWSGAWASTGNYQLVDLPGTYNITVRLYNQAYNKRYEDLNTFASNSFQSASSVQESGVVVKTYVLTNIDLNASTRSEIESKGCDVIINYGKEDGKNLTPSSWTDAYREWFIDHNQNGNSGFLCYIQVERVYEFHLLGGPYGTFNYDETQYFYEGEIGVTDTDAKTRTFGLNNVYFDASERTFTDTYVGVGDENRIGTFRNNVFTIDFMNTVWANNIQPFTADELAAINSYANNVYQEQDPNYVSIDDENESALLQTAVAKINPNDTDYDYQLSNVSRPEAVRTLLKITETGYYNFRIQVKFKSTTSTSNLESYVDSIKIAVSPVKSDYFVKIYRNDNFGRLYSDASGDHGFINHNGTLPSGNELLYTATFDEFGSPLSQIPFNSADNLETNKPFDSILAEYGQIYDHVTHNLVDRNMIIEKNCVFFVNQS